MLEEIKEMYGDIDDVIRYDAEVNWDTIRRLISEVERLQHESDIWEKLSLVEIATERDALRVEVERLREDNKHLYTVIDTQQGLHDLCKQYRSQESES